MKTPTLLTCLGLFLISSLTGCDQIPARYTWEKEVGVEIPGQEWHVFRRYDHWTGATCVATANKNALESFARGHLTIVWCP
jgi:hypothetical protein